MKIRLIAADLDGTLLEEDHVTVSKRNGEALEKASQQGAVVVIASGRTLAVLSGAAKRVKAAQYAIISNGASAVKFSDEKLMFLDGIPYEHWRNVYKILERHQSVFEIYCEGKSYLPEELLPKYQNPHLSEIFIQELKAHMLLSKDPLQELRGKAAEKISVLFTPEQYCESLEREIKALDGLAVTSSLPGNMEINRSDVNKGSGLKRLCAHLGIRQDEVMAFGDANNDLEMLSWAKWSFAMENGTEEAKQAAHFITDSNTEDGVAKAIEKYVLGNA